MYIEVYMDAMRELGIARSGRTRSTLQLVPTVHREGPYRFFFYMALTDEIPP